VVHLCNGSKKVKIETKPDDLRHLAFLSVNNFHFINELPWKHSRASPAINTISPLRRNIAVGTSSLVFPPRRKMHLQPKLIE
jgi:hypothetical protein